jgi:protein O-GlcNAc transferase
MRTLEIDIAVDLGGLTSGCRPRIFAYGAAPVQVNYLGFPGTMGATFLDYIIADTFVIPPPYTTQYSEQVVYLPDCFQANDDQRIVSAPSFGRAQVELPEKAFVFCCLNATYKINPRMFDVWMRLLKQVPASVLWLLGDHTVVRDNLRREASARGVDPRRLVFATRACYGEYLSKLQLADLYLDTLPFNAGATASDVLRAGVPLLTCTGEAFAARMAGSLLRAAELPELITTSEQEYESRALDLTGRPQDLKAMRQHLRNRGDAVLFNTDRFRSYLESAYQNMWLRHERGDEPASFAVTERAENVTNYIAK